MGDYTKNGVKIGTCGHAYYATKQMLEDIKTDPEAKQYLDPKNKCSFAFPFPEYDGKKVGEISNFHEGERAEQIIIIKREGNNTFHKHIIHHIHPKGGQGVNLFCNCPYESTEKTSRFEDKYFRFNLKDQKYYSSGELTITGDCIYCGESNVFTKEEAEEAANNLIIEADSLEKEAERYEAEGYSNAEGCRKQAARCRIIAERIIQTYNA